MEMEHVVLHRDDTMNYLGPSLCPLPNGDMLLSVREAHARPAELRSHVDPSARGVYFRSTDGGRTFGEKRVLDDRTLQCSATQDTILTHLSDGSLLASVYSWGIVPVPAGVATETLRYDGNVVGGPERPFARVFEGLWTRRSTDGGRTWTARHPVTVDGLPPLATRAPVVELDDGTLLMQVNDKSERVGKPRAWARIFCLRSTDRGETWSDPVLVADGSDEHIHYLEPSLIRLRNGKLLSVVRTRGEGDGYLYQTESTDSGRTWSEPERTPMWGCPAHVTELADGRLLCVYGYRRAPYGIRATLSRDGGATWDHGEELLLRDDGGSHDVGYPVATQRDDGTVLVAYYFNEERDGAPESSARYLAGTFLDP